MSVKVDSRSPTPVEEPEVAPVKQESDSGTAVKQESDSGTAVKQELDSGNERPSLSEYVFSFVCHAGFRNSLF
jgi:hypothetical protein